MMLQQTAVQFVLQFTDYLIEVLPYVAVGFFLSGLINEFVPGGWAEKHLGGRGVRPLLYSTLAGTILPICCFGSLPVAVSLHQKGARLGAVLAFLIATPATSVSALLVTYGLLGVKFTVYIFAGVIAMGLVAGLTGNLLRVRPVSFAMQQRTATDPVCGMQVQTEGAPSTEHEGTVYYFCCHHCQEAFASRPEQYLGAAVSSRSHRIKHVFRYAFVDMVKEIGPEMLLGLALAALVATVAPIGRFVGTYLAGAYGYLFSLVFGVAMYICATASVPLVHAFISEGMGSGAGMVLLIVGPVSSWGTILVLRKTFGGKILSIYLALVCAMALVLGYGFSLFA